jgi:hypothetical protein
VLQLDPYAPRLAAAQCERRVADAHDEGVTSRARLGEDLDLLAVHEPELEESALERRRGSCPRADARYAPTGARRQGRKAHETRFAAQTLGCSHSIHAAQYE